MSLRMFGKFVVRSLLIDEIGTILTGTFAALFCLPSFDLCVIARREDVWDAHSSKLWWSGVAGGLQQSVHKGIFHR